MGYFAYNNLGCNLETRQMLLMREVLRFKNYLEYKFSSELVLLRIYTKCFGS